MRETPEEMARKEVLERSKYTFQRLFRKGHGKDVRCPQATFVKAFDLRYKRRGGQSLRGSFERFMDGTAAPRDLRAWRIGSVYRQFGIPWMSGLFFLVTAGQIGDAIGIVATWLLLRDVPAQYTDRAWHMIALLPLLNESTKLDSIPALLNQYLRATYVPKPLARDLLKNTQTPKSTILGVEVTQAEVDRWLARELAKDAWSSYAESEAEFDNIAAMWFANCKLAESLPTLARASVSVGNANNLLLKERELSAIVIFGQWLNTIEVGADVYPRPIADRYCVSQYG